MKHVSAYSGVANNENRITKKTKAKHVSAYSDITKNKGGFAGGVGYSVARAGTDFLRVGEGVIDAALVPVDLITGNVQAAKSRFMNSPVDDLREELDRRYNPGKGMQVVGDITGGIGQSVGYGLLTMIPFAGAPMMYSSIVEQSISSAAERTGKVGAKEIGYGATMGAIEGVLETKLGAGVRGVKSIGSAILKRSGKEVVKSTAKTGGKTLVKTLLMDTAKGAAGEFAEEAISEALDPFVQRMYKIDENAQFDLGNVLYAGMIGGVSGGFISIGPSVGNYRQAVKTGRALQNSGMAKDVIKRAKYTLSGLESAKVRADGSIVQKPTGETKETSEEKRERKKSNRRAKNLSKQSANLTDKIGKNIAAYEKLRADPKTADSDATAAVLGELRGNMYMAAMSFEIDTVEAAMKDASAEMKQMFVDAINEEAAMEGKKHDYTVEDFDADLDDIRRGLAGRLTWEEMAGLAEIAQYDRSEDSTMPEEEQEDVWAGMTSREEIDALGATEEAEAALVREAINQGVPKASMQAMLDEYRKGTQLSPAEFAEAWAEGAMVYGRYGFDTKGIDQKSALGRMEQQARDAALEFGRQNAEKARAKEAEEVLKKKKTEQKQSEEKAETDQREGRLIKGEGLNMRDLTGDQYAVYKQAEIMAKAIGANIYIEADLGRDSRGRRINGYYDRATNEIHININAMRRGKHIAMYVLGHEVTHYIKAWSSEKFYALGDFVMKKLGQKAETAVRSKYESLKNTDQMRGKTLEEAYDLAYEEVVADGMEMVLADGKIMSELAQTNADLFSKIKSWITNAIAKIKKYYGSLNQASKTAQVLADSMETFDEIEQLFLEGIREASERTEGAEYGVEIDENTGTALFSVQDAPQNEAEVDAAVERLVKSLGVSEERARNWVENEMSLSALILREDMYDWAHKKADRRLTAIVKNSDYKQGTLDFSNICRKRRQYTKMMERLQRAFPNRLFSAEDFALIRDILVDEEIEVACGLCYVEDRRQNEGYIATNFREAVQSWRAGNKTTFRDSKSDADVAYSKGAAKAMDMLGNDAYVPTIADLTTVDGMAELGRNHPDVLRAWKAFNNSRGMQSSRLVTAEAEYQRQILKYSKARVKTINDLGGLRIFSFSDFEEFHLIDIIQAVQDCAAMGIKIQFYTKVPSFAYLMKDTGAKGNMSLIPKGKLGYHMEGSRVVLDYDNVEGIDTNNKYFKMLSRNNPNIGTVLVGINETQIRAAMADSFIDYIIPFHSGQSGIVRQIKKIDAWENYKDVQTEKWLTKAEEGEKRGSAGVNIYTDVLQAAEKEGRPITNERQFVEKFLQVCEDKGAKPRFWEFLDTDADGKYVYTKGYYKLLLDFKMFDKNGQILPQEVVVPEFDSGLLTELTEKYVAAEKEGDAKTDAAFARAYDKIVDRVINRNDPIYRTIKQPKLAPAVPNVKAVEAIKRADKVFSLGEDTDTDYLAAVERGDMETAQRMVDEAAKAAGYTEEMFHGMGGRYNVYKSGNGQYGSGVYFTADKDIAADYGKVVDHLYVKVGKIADYEDSYRALGKMDDQTLDDFAQTLGFPSFDDMANDWDNDPTDVASNPELIDMLINRGFEGFVDDGNAGFVLWDFDGIAYRIKSADPVTYDDNGNVIPLSERFNEKNPDIRYSLGEDTDTDYLAAVERGDMGTVQRMVDEKARRSGYDTPRLFHGTTRFGFTKFDLGKSRDRVSIFATSSKDVADTYATKDSRRRISDRSTITPEALESADEKQITDLLNKYLGGNFKTVSTAAYLKTARSQVEQLAEDLESFQRENEELLDSRTKAILKREIDAVRTIAKTDVYEEFQKAYSAYEKAVWDLKFANDEVGTEARSLVGDTMRKIYQTYDRILGEGDTSYSNGQRTYTRSQAINELMPKMFSGVYELYGRMKKPLYIRGEGASWNRLDGSEIGLSGFVNTHDVVEYALENGYDGVVFEDIVDVAGETEGTGSSDVYAFFGSNALKSADPVTYDDNGNVIPLSERFNEENEDIRYSLGEAENGDVRENEAEGEMTDREMLLAMAERLVGSEEENRIVSNYKIQYDAIRKKQTRIDDLTDRQRELQSIMFTDTDAKARSEAAKELRSIHEEMNALLEDVAKADRKLTEIEGMKAIRNLIQRERLAVRETYQNKYETMYKRKMEARETTDARRSVRRLYNRVNRLLFSPTKARNVPIGMQGIVAEALKAANIDVEAIERLGQLEERLAALERDPAPDIAKMAELEQRIEEQESRVGKVKDQVNVLVEIFEATSDKNADGETQLVFDEVVLQKLKDLRKEIGNSSIKNMNRSQLLALKEFYDMIWHRVTTANNILATNRKIGINQIGERSAREVRDSKAPKIMSQKKMEAVGMRGVRRFMWSNLKPLTAFEVLGSDTFMGLFKEVLRGEDVWSTDVEEAYNHVREAKEKYGYDSWNLIERKKVETASGAVDLSLSEIMSLYAYSFREQARYHLMGGGFVLDPNAIARVKGAKIGFVELEKHLNDTTRYTMTEEQIGQLGSYLTEDQRAYVKDVQNYLTEMGEKGNTVSRKLYGIDIFKEKFYFPIKVKSEYLESQTGRTGDPKIKNRGMTKEVVPEAKNPLVLQDFMAVAGDHINSMATYHAFVLPVEDLTRVLNFKPTNVKIDENGNPVLDKNGMPVADEDASVKYDTLKSEIEAKYGAEAIQYIEQMIRDLNGGARSDAVTTLLDKGLTAFKRAATMMSLSTIIQQPTSIFRAMAYVDAKYFAGAKFYDYDTVKKYAKVAFIKKMGGFDTGTGVRTEEYINQREYKTLAEKAKAVAMPEMLGGDATYRAETFGWLTQKADEVAWRYLFGACVNEQAAKMKQSADSEAVLKAAGERFSEVVRHTQVYDSTLTRSALMRSKDTGAKLVTQFGAEPTTIVSMLVSGIVKAERGDTTFFRKTAGALALSIVMNAMAVSLIYAMRDDDEDKNYAEKYISTLTGELIEGFNLLEYIPYVRDIMSVFKGYEVERSDMTLIGNLFDQIELITSSKRSLADKMIGVSGAVAAFFGVPINNVYRDAKGAVKTAISAAEGKNTMTSGGVGSAVKEGVRSQYSLFFKLFGEQDGNANELYKAALRGDTSHYERVAARYASASAAEQALRKELRDNDKRIAQAAEAKISGDLGVYESIIKQIEREGHFDRDLVIRAVNNEVMDIKDVKNQATVPKDDSVTEEDEAEEALYSTSDLIDALDRGDKADFADVYDYVVSYKVKLGKTEEQAKAAIKSSVTSKYKKMYLEAWADNNTSEMKRLLALLAGTGLYGTRDDTAKTVEKWVRDANK